MNYTNAQLESMYLDWFNNFLSCDAWRQHYNLGMAEGENILDMGRRLNQSSSGDSPSKYPFKEGDEYYTLTKDGHLMFTIWDKISEQIHDEDNGTRVYFNEEQMIEFVKNNTLHPLS
jgi:hypothetical protein|tara:strand:+ start:1665 stop:2015 length:351 start_codon:yes stop_codon:yes gene_type:complete